LDRRKIETAICAATDVVEEEEVMVGDEVDEVAVGTSTEESRRRTSIGIRIITMLRRHRRIRCHHPLDL
jgi:hypothetical protein